MRDNLGGALWRLAAFMTVCLLGHFALLAVFAQLRFQAEHVYRAVFTNVSGLEVGNFVRLAGVEVGKVQQIWIDPDNVAVVEFSADESVVLTEGTRVAIRYGDLIGGRYVALEEGAGGTRRLGDGDTIGQDRTEPALDLDALIGGFRPLFRALDPDDVNALTGQLINALQGQGTTIGSFLSRTASLTNTLADRDELIGDVITNLNTVLTSLGDESAQLGKAVDSLAELIDGLASRKADISNAVAYGNEAAETFAELLQQTRPGVQKTVHQGDRVGAIIVADYEYVDRIINTLPDKYRALGRQGLYGDYFSFYLCDVVAKLNGKGGQPVYVTLASQQTGRCAPK